MVYGSEGQMSRCITDVEMELLHGKWLSSSVNSCSSGVNTALSVVYASGKFGVPSKHNDKILVSEFTGQKKRVENFKQ